jgi:hypothetical protein
MKRATVRPAVAAVSALAAVVAVVADVGSPMQGPLIGWFLLVCPGMTVLALLPSVDPLLELAATFAISIALGVVVAESLLYLDLWSPVRCLGILAALTVAGAGLSLRPGQDFGTRAAGSKR